MRNVAARQHAAWCWAASLAPALTVLPGAGGWSVPLLALPAVWAADRLLRRAEAHRGWDRRFGGALTIIYIMWAVVLGGTQLRIGVHRVGTAVNLAVEPWLLAAGVVLLAVWMARGTPAACARWARMVLKGTLVALGGIVLLSLRQMRWESLLPLWKGGVDWFGVTGLTGAVLCVRVYGGFVSEDGGGGMRYLPPVCLLLSALLVAIEGNLGTALAARVEDPLLTLSRNVGVEGTFQRAESLLAAGLLLVDLALLTLLLWAAQGRLGRFWPTVGLAIFVAASLPVSAAGMELFRNWILPVGNFALGLVVPLFLLVVGRAKDGKTRAYIVPENRGNGTS